MASNTKYYDNLTVSSSPHLVTSLDTTRTMLYVVAALLPAAAMSVLYFGIPAVIMIAVCMICSAFFEWAYEKLLNKPNTVRDGSALVTGLILALNLPANLTHLDGIEYPIFMPILICIIGSFVAQSSVVSPCSCPLPLICPHGRRPDSRRRLLTLLPAPLPSAIWQTETLPTALP